MTVYITVEDMQCHTPSLVPIGSTINVKKMYDRIQHLRNAAGSLQEFRNKMRHIMKLTEPLDRIVENLGKTEEKNNA
jgi:prefoldin subunit 5